MHSMQLCILLFSCRHTDTRNDFLHTTQHIRIIMGEIIWNRSFDSDIHKLFLQIGTICASQTIGIQSSTGFRWSTLKRQISAFQLLVAQQLYKMISVIDIWINNREIQYSNVQHITYPPFKTKTWIFWGQLVEPQPLLTLLPIHLDSFSQSWLNSPLGFLFWNLAQFSRLAETKKTVVCLSICQTRPKWPQKVRQQCCLCLCAGKLDKTE